MLLSILGEEALPKITSTGDVKGIATSFFKRFLGLKGFYVDVENEEVPVDPGDYFELDD